MFQIKERIASVKKSLRLVLLSELYPEEEAIRTPPDRKGTPWSYEPMRINDIHPILREPMRIAVVALALLAVSTTMIILNLPFSKIGFGMTIATFLCLVISFFLNQETLAGESPPEGMMTRDPVLREELDERVGRQLREIGAYRLSVRRRHHKGSLMEISKYYSSEVVIYTSDRIFVRSVTGVPDLVWDLESHAYSNELQWRNTDSISEVYKPVFSALDQKNPNGLDFTLGLMD